MMLAVSVVLNIVLLLVVASVGARVNVLEEMNATLTGIIAAFTKVAEGMEKEMGAK